MLNIMENLRLGTTSQKVLLLLLAGLALGITSSPNRQRRILRAAGREWRSLKRRELYRSIERLYESKLVFYKEQKDGSIIIELNRNGKKAALTYKIDEMSIPKPTRWDGKWRIVLFDIPESIKKLRNTLRTKLRQLGLLELQKSVFIHPYECRDEIDFVIELYNARKFVRFIEATGLDNELHFKHKFKLL